MMIDSERVKHVQVEVKVDKGTERESLGGTEQKRKKTTKMEIESDQDRKEQRYRDREKNKKRS